MFRMKVEAKINRLSREIAPIDRFFYGASENDANRSLHAGMLERKRDDMIRGIVSQLHTAIEDILNTAIICSIFNVKAESRMQKSRSSKRARALRKMLFGPVALAST
jgi:hypothetical protein